MAILCFQGKGFVRKSGGRKHKKKPAGAGKGPAAKGGGKRFAAGGFVSGWFPMTLHDHVTVRLF